jgi:hypothetical protein
MDYVPANVVDAMRGSHDLGVFIRIDSDPALHVWLGVEDKPAGIDSIDPDGTVYLGGGQLIGVPALEVLVNGKSDNVEFFMSGIDPATGGRMLDEMPAIRGKTVQVGITTLDPYFQPMSAIIPLWSGVASHPSESSPVVKTGQNRSLRLALSVVAGENARSRTSKSVWSHAQQIADFPTDDFCKNMQRLARGVQAVWPNN